MAKAVLESQPDTKATTFVFSGPNIQFLFPRTTGEEAIFTNGSAAAMTITDGSEIAMLRSQCKISPHLVVESDKPVSKDSVEDAAEPLLTPEQRQAMFSAIFNRAQKG